MRFKTKRLELRPFYQDDSEQILGWRNREEIYKYAKTPIPVTEQEHKQWWENYFLDDKTIRFIIIESAQNYEIGMIGCTFIDNKVIISYYLADDTVRGKGYAQESIRGLLYQLSDMKYEGAIQAQVHKENKASIKCLERCGFLKIDQVDELFELYEYKDTKS